MSGAYVIGGGLAGCEAAWALANAGVKVVLYEQKPHTRSAAHTSDSLGELVCSNSLKAMRIESAAGLLKEEMKQLGSLIMEAAEHSRVSAGGALAVDRTLFSGYITNAIESHPNIEVKHQEAAEIFPGKGIIATGPLTSDAFAKVIERITGKEYLSFYDAASPIVSFESIDRDKVFFAARYDRGDSDYINCPLNEEEYERFYKALVEAETVALKSFETLKVYEGCMPVEVLAKRGYDALRYGPMKPVGLTDPKTGRWPFAVVQLRQENSKGSMYNLVGFQTNLKFPEQKRVFSMIPGLENAEFLRFGVMHRNTFINSPALLNEAGRLKSNPDIYFAGQITGVEGYIESAVSGIMAGINLAREINGKPFLILPKETMTGALLNYASSCQSEDFQPMGCNMGLLPPLDRPVRPKAKKYEMLAARALDALDGALK